MQRLDARIALTAGKGAVSFERKHDLFRPACVNFDRDYIVKGLASDITHRSGMNFRLQGGIGENAIPRGLNLEFVAHQGNGDDHFRSFGKSLKLLAQTRDVHVDGSG